jgi:hypothetical protein
VVGDEEEGQPTTRTKERPGEVEEDEEELAAGLGVLEALG